MIVTEPSNRGKRGPDKRPRRLVAGRDYIPDGRDYIPQEELERELARTVGTDLTEQELYDSVAEKQMSVEERQRTVPERLGQILHEYFDFDYMPFHIEMLEEMFRGGKIVMNLPTDHAKSWCGCFFFPIMSLMNDPNASHIICGANFEDSKGRIGMIELELETNKKLLEWYPWLQKPRPDEKQVWSTVAMTVRGRTMRRKDPSVSAASPGARDVLTRRGKLIFDDCEGPDHMGSKLKRNRLYDFIKLAALRTFEDKHESPRPLTLGMGTPFDPDSIYFRLERENWRVFRRKVYVGLNAWGEMDVANGVDPAEDPRKHELLWPAKFDKVLEQWGGAVDEVTGKTKAGMDKGQFAIAYLMDPKAANPSRLTLEEIEEMTRTAEMGGDTPQLFISIDPAGGSSARYADYCGITLNEISWPRDQKLPWVRVLEAHKLTHPQGLFEHVDLAAELAARYPSARIIYESNSQQGSVYLNCFQHRQPQVVQRLIRFHTSADNKFDNEMGLTVVRRLVVERHLGIAASEFDLEGAQTFREEIRDLGARGTDDHICASIWFVVRYIYDQLRMALGPHFSNGWTQETRTIRQDYIDRDPAPTPAPIANGWGALAPYRKW